jgi:8-oxo-dGTP pyrophosphatase MutT (NUDIX family)
VSCRGMFWIFGPHMPMHLFLERHHDCDDSLLADLIVQTRNQAGEFHAFFPTSEPGVVVHENSHLECLGSILAGCGLDPDDCTLIGSSRRAQESARLARVRFAGLRTPGSDLPTEPLEHDFADMAEVLAWFEKTVRLDTCGWPIATVGGLVFRPDGKAFFVRTAKWSGRWGTPGGKIEYGETHLQAFVREMREETGLVVEGTRLVLVQEAIEDPDFYKKRHFLLLNFVGRTQDDSTLLNHESLDGAWFGLSDALTMDLNRPTRLLVEYLIANQGDLP